MIESVINKINDSENGIESMSLGWKINGLCEMITEEFTFGPKDNEQTIEAKFPALYEGKDHLSYISHYDYRVGVVFHIPNGDQTEVDLDEIRVSQRRVERTWPMRLIAIVRRNIYNTDNAYSPLELISNLKAKISRRNITELRSDLGVEKIKVTTGSSSFDKKQILEDTFVNIDFKATHDLMVVRIDYDIVISGDEQCFYEYGCPVIEVEDNPTPECETLILGDIQTSSLVEAAYSSTVIPSNGTAPFTFSMTGSFPGVTINPNTGELSGFTTLSSADYIIEVTCTDANGCTGSREYVIEVNEFYNLLARVILKGGNITGALIDKYKTMFKGFTSTNTRNRWIRLQLWRTDTFTGTECPAIFSDVSSSIPIGYADDLYVNFVAGDWGINTGLQGSSPGQKAIRDGIIPANDGIAGNNMSLMVINETSGSTIGIETGFYSGANWTMLVCNIGGNTWFPIGNNGNVFVANAQDTGRFIATRNGDNNCVLYRNGAQLDSQPVGANIASTAEGNTFRSDNVPSLGDYSSRRLRGRGVLRGLSAQQALDIDNILSAFLA